MREGNLFILKHQSHRIVVAPLHLQHQNSTSYSDSLHRSCLQTLSLILDQSPGIVRCVGPIFYPIGMKHRI